MTCENMLERAPPSPGESPGIQYTNNLIYKLKIIQYQDKLNNLTFDYWVIGLLYLRYAATVIFHVWFFDFVFNNHLSLF